jgi:hypothetical protein
MEWLVGLPGGKRNSATTPEDRMNNFHASRHRTKPDTSSDSILNEIPLIVSSSSSKREFKRDFFVYIFPNF